MSVELLMRFDMRVPDLGTSPEDLYAAALEMGTWADEHGFHVFSFTEHHGADDGDCPAPFLIAAAMAGRTKRVRLRVCAVILPLHDPVTVAEETAVLDLLSNGRAELVMGAGYATYEFEMFGVPLDGRARILEERVEIITSALSGEPFDFDGRKGTVTPLPVQRPRPPIYLGGGVKAAARRAARFGDGFISHATDPELFQLYREECARLGRTPGPAFSYTGHPPAVFVVDDPEEAWATIGPHAAHHQDSYVRMAAGSPGMRSPYVKAETLEAVRSTGKYLVVTPEQCVAFAQKMHDEGGGALQFMPFLGGMNPEFGWECMELFASKVQPELEARGLLGPLIV